MIPHISLPLVEELLERPFDRWTDVERLRRWVGYSLGRRVRIWCDRIRDLGVLHGAICPIRVWDLDGEGGVRSPPVQINLRKGNRGDPRQHVGSPGYQNVERVHDNAGDPVARRRKAGRWRV